MNMYFVACDVTLSAHLFQSVEVPTNTNLSICCVAFVSELSKLFFEGLLEGS